MSNEPDQNEVITPVPVTSTDWFGAYAAPALAALILAAVAFLLDLHGVNGVRSFSE